MKENKEKGVVNQQDAGEDIAKAFGIFDEGMTEEQQKAFVKFNKSMAIADDITDIFNDNEDVSVNVMMVAFGIFIKRVDDAIDMEKYDQKKETSERYPIVRNVETHF